MRSSSEMWQVWLHCKLGKNSNGICDSSLLNLNTCSLVRHGQPASKHACVHAVHIETNSVTTTQCRCQKAWSCSSWNTTLSWLNKFTTTGNVRPSSSGSGRTARTPENLKKGKIRNAAKPKTFFIKTRNHLKLIREKEAFIAFYRKI